MTRNDTRLRYYLGNFSSRLFLDRHATYIIVIFENDRFSSFLSVSSTVARIQRFLTLLNCVVDLTVLVFLLKVLNNNVIVFFLFS